MSLAQVIRSGRVKLYKNLDDGREFVLGFRGPGKHLGLSAVYSKTHAFSAEAVQPTSVCAIDMNTYLRLLEQQSELAWRVFGELGRELEDSRHRLLNLALKSARERVASHLLSLTQIASSSCNSRIVALESSRQDVSRMIGLRAETVFRILTDFHEEHLIRLSPRSRQIEILDVPGLEQLSR